MKIARIISDQSGGVLVEATVVLLLTLLVLFGSVVPVVADELRRVIREWAGHAGAHSYGDIS